MSNPENPTPPIQDPNDQALGFKAELEKTMQIAGRLILRQGETLTKTEAEEKLHSAFEADSHVTEDGKTVFTIPSFAELKADEPAVKVIQAERVFGKLKLQFQAIMPDEKAGSYWGEGEDEDEVKLKIYMLYTIVRLETQTELFIDQMMVFSDEKTTGSSGDSLSINLDELHDLDEILEFLGYARYNYSDEIMESIGDDIYEQEIRKPKGDMQMLRNIQKISQQTEAGENDWKIAEFSHA